jgi:hypothetical protein
MSLNEMPQEGGTKQHAEVDYHELGGTGTKRIHLHPIKMVLEDATSSVIKYINVNRIHGYQCTLSNKFLLFR